MKRLITGLLPLFVVAGTALAVLPLTLAFTTAPDALGAPATARALQLNGYPVPEPVTIVLSSIALLGWTTTLRRRRMNRRS